VPGLIHRYPDRVVFTGFIVLPNLLPVLYEEIMDQEQKGNPLEGTD